MNNKVIGIARNCGAFFKIKIFIKRQKKRSEKRKGEKNHRESEKGKRKKCREGAYWQPAGVTCRLLLCTDLWRPVRPGTKR